ncbi:putative pentatricopeptide repeat-containing protein [Vitis vinifera]|uniref:Putative pentatricopeptide repeat-containing protein n=1 Tax=Vitis vinifera TaxID=29760 RepID=A0A438KJA6_VITVI|nr:putative pentatricopeptide repeat-containing protein [Vitis vinifera]
MGGKEDIALWNAIMSVYVQTKNAKESVTFFCELLHARVEPDYITFLSLISACVQLSSLNLSNSVMAYVIQKGFDKHIVISNALIDLFARCGNISIAKKIFEGLSSKDAVSWSTMINGYGLHGDSEAALALLSQMRLSGMKPDGITYASVLSACSHGGFIDQGWMIFNSMVEEGVPRRMEHYACMVDLLGRTGQLNEAYDFVEKLPCKPSDPMSCFIISMQQLEGGWMPIEYMTVDGLSFSSVFSQEMLEMVPSLTFIKQEAIRPKLLLPACVFCLAEGIIHHSPFEGIVSWSPALDQTFLF